MNILLNIHVQEMADKRISIRLKSLTNKYFEDKDIDDEDDVEDFLKSIQYLKTRFKVSHSLYSYLITTSLIFTAQDYQTLIRLPLLNHRPLRRPHPAQQGAGPRHDPLLPGPQAQVPRPPPPGTPSSPTP